MLLLQCSVAQLKKHFLFFPFIFFCWVFCVIYKTCTPSRHHTVIVYIKLLSVINGEVFVPINFQWHFKSECKSITFRVYSFKLNFLMNTLHIFKCLRALMKTHRFPSGMTVCSIHSFLSNCRQWHQRSNLTAILVFFVLMQMFVWILQIPVWFCCFLLLKLH